MSRHVFVIMPSKSDIDFEAKVRTWKKLARQINCEVIVPEYDPDQPVFDLDRTLEELKKCNLVVADVSLERPSCYFELGLAEALHKNVTVISKIGTPIHQTSHRCEVRTYRSLDDFAALIWDILHSNGSCG